LAHQAEHLYLARLNTTGRSPGIPEGAAEDRLAHCHSFLRHGRHTVGLGNVLKVYSFRSAVFCATGPPLVGCGSSPRTDGLGRREAIIRIYRPWRIARAPLGPPVSPPRQPSDPGTARPTPLDPLKTGKAIPLFHRCANIDMLRGKFDVHVTVNRNKFL